LKNRQCQNLQMRTIPACKDPIIIQQRLFRKSNGGDLKKSSSWGFCPWWRETQTDRKNEDVINRKRDER